MHGCMGLTFINHYYNFEINLDFQDNVNHRLSVGTDIWQAGIFYDVSKGTDFPFIEFRHKPFGIRWYGNTDFAFNFARELGDLTVGLDDIGGMRPLAFVQNTLSSKGGPYLRLGYLFDQDDLYI